MKPQIAFIEPGKPALQFGEALPKGAERIENWRFISPLEIAEKAALLAGEASLLTFDAKASKANQ